MLTQGRASLSGTLRLKMDPLPLTACSQCQMSDAFLTAPEGDAVLKRVAVFLTHGLGV